MRMNKPIIAITLITLLLVSCRIMPGLMADPHSVTVGMTKDEVMEAMDGLEPDGRFISGQIEIWTYKGNYSIWSFSFTGGVITSISYLYLEDL